MKRPSPESDAISARLHPLDTLVDALTDSLEGINRQLPIWVGLSGGVDSTALLLAAAQLSARDPALLLKAIHVNHHLQPESDSFEAHCLRLAHQLKIPLEVVHTQVNQHIGESLEEAARNARYAAFLSHIQSGESLCLAHQLEDQAETLLMNLFRGSGIEGIRAMPVRTERSGRWIIRPFLHLPRATLKAALEAAEIAAIEDPSNQSPRFDRNFLRHKVLPLLRERWSAIDTTLARAASLCAESAQMQALYQAQLIRDAVKNRCLRLAALRPLSEPDQRLAVRGWLHAEGFRPPHLGQLRNLIHEALTAGPDRNPCIRWKGAEVRRYRDHLYVMRPAEPLDKAWSTTWERPEDVIALPQDLGSLRIETGAPSGLPSGIWTQKISVRFRQGGESFLLPGGKAHHELRKFFQEQGTPPWIRERTPLVYVNDTLIAIGDQWLGNADAFENQSAGFSRIVWQRLDGAT